MLYELEYYFDMNIIQRLIIVWASQRVNYLDSSHRYEDSYAVSQEFCEWTTSLNTHPDGLKNSTLKVPNFDRENRTG